MENPRSVVAKKWKRPLLPKPVSTAGSCLSNGQAGLAADVVVVSGCDDVLARRQIA
jgi:hypothetical protein